MGEPDISAERISLAPIKVNHIDKIQESVEVPCPWNTKIDEIPNPQASHKVMDRRIRLGEQCMLDEDMHTEFKMHTKHSLFEIPPRCQAYHKGRLVRRMQPTSKTISAFLNTDGGTIYVGIDDQAVIRGIKLTAPMKDHFILSLEHCLSQFTPRVPAELVQVQFLEIDDGSSESVQVVSQSSADVPAAADALNDNEDNADMPVVDGAPNGNEDNSEAEFQRLVTKEGPRSHRLGWSCPCESVDLEAKLYLIVIEVHKSTNGTIYQNEEGLPYRRCNGANQMMTINDLNTFMRTDRIEENVGWWDWLRRLGRFIGIL